MHGPIQPPRMVDFTTPFWWTVRFPRSPRDWKMTSCEGEQIGPASRALVSSCEFNVKKDHEFPGLTATLSSSPDLARRALNAASDAMTIIDACRIIRFAARQISLFSDTRTKSARLRVRVAGTTSCGLGIGSRVPAQRSTTGD